MSRRRYNVCGYHELFLISTPTCGCLRLCPTSPPGAWCCAHTIWRMVVCAHDRDSGNAHVSRGRGADSLAEVLGNLARMETLEAIAALQLLGTEAGQLLHALAAGSNQLSGVGTAGAFLQPNGVAQKHEQALHSGRLVAGASPRYSLGWLRLRLRAELRLRLRWQCRIWRHPFRHRGRVLQRPRHLRDVPQPAHTPVVRVVFCVSGASAMLVPAEQQEREGAQ